MPVGVNLATHLDLFGPRPRKVVNVASVPQLSPLRYPGGKTWLVPEIRTWLTGISTRPSTFVEPFAGGGIASLTAVFEGHVDRAVLCELDHGIAALWRVILKDGPWLANKILSFTLSEPRVIEYLSRSPSDQGELAFQILLRNRVQRGGILAKGASLMRSGENGKGIASRWYPETLARRIVKIFDRRERIEIIEGDGFEIIKQYRFDPRAVFFVDPPYTAGGKRAGRRLYTHNQLDHDAVFRLMSEVAGSFLMTYDESPEVEALVREHKFAVGRIPMKNTHHAQMFELLIGRATDASNIKQVCFEYGARIRKVKRHVRHDTRRS